MNIRRALRSAGRTRWVGLFLLPLLLPPAEADAQIPEPPPAHLAAMERLAGWVGEWEGEGWAATGPDRREEFRIVESVRLSVRGTVLLVEGRGTLRHDGEEEVVVHEALTVVSYDAEGDRYPWRSYDLRGGVIDAELQLTGDGARWGFRDEERGNDLRFTIRLDGDRWDEVGEISLDGGTTWYRMLEMTLHRKAGGAP